MLLHGDAGSWTHWVRNVLPLAQRFRVIVPDLPEYGESDALFEPILPDLLAGTLAGAFHALAGTPSSYQSAGFLFGGIVAGHLAATEDRPVERLALVGADGLGLPRPGHPRPGEMAAGAIVRGHRQLGRKVSWVGHLRLLAAEPVVRCAPASAKRGLLSRSGRAITDIQDTIYNGPDGACHRQPITVRGSAGHPARVTEYGQCYAMNPA